MADESQTRPVLPSPFRKGAPVRASEMEQLRGAVAFALKSMIGAGPGILVSRRGDKYLIGLERNGRNGGYPFMVSDASTSAPAAKVTVGYGTVTGGGVNAIPTIGGTSIFTSPAPTLTVVTGTIYLDATVDAAGAITALAIANAATTPTDTSTHKYRTITSVTVVSNAVTAIAKPQAVQTALTLFICNGSAIWERA